MDRHCEFVASGSVPLGFAVSSNKAEYQGLIEGLEYLRDNIECDGLYIRGDSELVIFNCSVNTMSTVPTFDFIIKPSQKFAEKSGLRVFLSKSHWSLSKLWGGCACKRSCWWRLLLLLKKEATVVTTLGRLCLAVRAATDTIIFHGITLFENGCAIENNL